MNMPIGEPWDVAGADAFTRAHAGDRAAFETLLRLHERSALRLATRLMGSLEDGQDVTQEVFLKLHRQIERFDSVDEIGPWLYRVIVNACFDSKRKQRRSRLEPIGRESATWHSQGPSPEDSAARQQDRDLLRAGIEMLSERERAVIALREMAELSTNEVAKILGSTESTVRVQLSVARVKLRNFFAEARRK